MMATNSRLCADMGCTFHQPTEANARLIAEAPAMLEALRAIRTKAAECGNDTSAPDHVAALFYDIVEDANDILARIDGETA